MFLLQIEELDSEINAMQIKYKKTRKLFITSLQNNLVKDIRIAKLEAVLKTHGIVANPEEFSLDQFVGFSKHFDEKLLAQLRGLDYSSAGDSSFLKKCIVHLYKNNLSLLANRTPCGRNEHTVKRDGKVVATRPRKEAVSPGKIIILKEIFAERIDALPSLDVLEKEARKKQMGTKLSKVIDDIRVHDLKLPRIAKQIKYQ